MTNGKTQIIILVIGPSITHLYATPTEPVSAVATDDIRVRLRIVPSPEN